MVFTSPQESDPTVLDHLINVELLDQSLLQESTFDEFGELKDHMAMLLNTFLDVPTQVCHK